MPTTKQDYIDALNSQSAVNLSGLAHSLSAVVTRIWDDARAQGRGTDYVNNHPIVRFYIAQLDFLCRTDYSDAYQIVSKVAAGELDPVLIDSGTMPRYVSNWLVSKGE